MSHYPVTIGFRSQIPRPRFPLRLRQSLLRLRYSRRYHRVRPACKQIPGPQEHRLHLDAETLKPLLEVNADLDVVVPAANQDFAANRLGVDPTRLRVIDAGQELVSGPFHLRAVPAAHETVERDEHGRCKFIGLVANFGTWTIYHSGDTMLYDGMVDSLKPFSIDLAILPINGRAPERRVSGNLWGREAAELAKAIGARHVVPCHYDMFEFNTESPDEFIAACQSLGQSYDVLQCGQRWSSKRIA